MAAELRAGTNDPVAVRAWGAADPGPVRAFYRSLGKSAAPGAGEELVVAEADGALVGALRLCSEAGTLVLRAFYITEAWRFRGAGSRMLALASGLIGGRECHCLAFRHLERFYRRAGFRAIPEAGVPAHLRERLARYRAGGGEWLALRRDGAA